MRFFFWNFILIELLFYYIVGLVEAFAKRNPNYKSVSDSVYRVLAALIRKVINGHDDDLDPLATMSISVVKLDDLDDISALQLSFSF